MPDDPDSVSKSATRRPPLRRVVRAKVWGGSSRILAALPQGIAKPILQMPAAVARKTGPGRLARANIDRVLGETWSEEKRAELHRDVFRHVARQAAETSRLAHASPGRLADWLSRHVHIDPSIDHLHAALRFGRGALVLTGHIGNWDVLAAALAHAGFQGSVVGRYRRRDPSAAWFVGMRANYGVPTLAQDSDPRDLMRVLKRGELLGLLCDLEVRRLHGDFVPFFGMDALTMSAPAALARACGAPAVPIRCVRLASDPTRYTLLAEPALVLEKERPKAESQRRFLTAMNETYERWILETPEQWAWYQHRFRTRPGELESKPITVRRLAANPEPRTD